MIRAAFYAPMKSPNHPVASGDRAVARALLSALRAADISVDLASEVQIRDGAGDKQVQKELMRKAHREIKDLIPEGRARRWQVWITYHNYYKAPDLIGPSVCAALAIPYIQIESTRARKRLTGPWADFAGAAEAATDAAAVVFYFTLRDEEALVAYGPAEQRHIHLRPFLARDTLPDATTGQGFLLAVGMFRAGDKLASYELLADTLSQLSATDWHLEIAGDGPERARVETFMRSFGNKVRFLGALKETEMEKAYQRARILFWPGVNEAFGMTYLEAQATGLTVLAQDRPGVRDVLAPGAAYPSPENGSAALAARLDMLLCSPKMVMHLGQLARSYVGANHLMNRACETLGKTVREVTR